MSADPLADLTAAQRDAVTHFEGPVLVLAGPGSGKTRVITRRVAWLVHEGVKPWNILAITFTNKAAGEMRQRIQALVPNSRVWVSTFHSLGARLLRQYADRLQLDRNFTIYDQDDRNRLVKAALEAAGIDNVRFPPERIESAISRAKNQLLGPQAYANQARDFFTQTVARVYPNYEKKLRDANAVDFDDLLLLPAIALRHDAELRAELDSRFKFVLIDEYQDTNQAQYAIARGLTIDHPNLCVVGDPDQSIYKWRGSDIRNILDFERDYPDARVVLLDRNYRSTKAVLRTASHLIAHNRQRKPKDLFTDNAEGQPVGVLTFDTGLDEADGVARRIRAAVDKGKRRFRDFAIFMRVNALSRSLEDAFIRHRVPYQMVRGLAFFERKENKDILAYVRLILNPRDNLSFLRVVNEPPRGIGKVSLEHLREYAEPREMSLLSAAAQIEQVPAIKGKAATGLRAFARLIGELAELREAPPDQVIRAVIDRTGYRRMLKESNDEDDVNRLANIEELITAAQQFAGGGEQAAESGERGAESGERGAESGERELSGSALVTTPSVLNAPRAPETGQTIADFIENITLASDLDGWNEAQDCVSVMTLHAAKGLEFAVVYMIAVEQGLLPHDRALRDKSSEDLEEERRLAFVGMTRAEDELYLCHARQRMFRGIEISTIDSMFLEELPEDVAHEDLGSGHAGRAFDEWRGDRADADPDWYGTGVERRAKSGERQAKSGKRRAEDEESALENVASDLQPAHGPSGTPRSFVEGMLVQHETYGPGRVTEVFGHGAMRKIKVRFRTAGERTFLADKAKLAIVGK